MSSGFISGGTSENPTERNELWKQAERELEAARQSKEIQKTHDGKSLYEVLQANKAAKQEAFEEAAKLKNQFRSLDEDDIDFLNSIRDADSAKEAAVRQNTEKQLESFRRQQQAQNQNDVNTESAAASAGSEPISAANNPGGLDWRAAPKKRKRQNKDETSLKGPKLIKSLVSKPESSGVEIPAMSGMETEEDTTGESQLESQEPKNRISSISPLPIEKGSSAHVVQGEIGKISSGPAYSVLPQAYSTLRNDSKTSTTRTTNALGLTGYISDDE